jgi:two-component system chemotaxis response regulator CheB
MAGSVPPFGCPGHDIVAIGASAGGVEALSRLVNDLPAELPAALFVVLHVASGAPSNLPAILNRARRLPAAHAADNEGIRTGRIYVAPPDRHLVLADGHVRITMSPRENGHRPAVDPLFRSAARIYGQRVIGVVLSGYLDDGTMGLRLVKERGGIAVVQDPHDATAPDMPRNALEHVVVDHCVALDELGPLLVRLVDEAAVTPSPAGDEGEPAGKPSGFTCPECHGSLAEVEAGDFVHFRCRIGHAYSPESLLAQQADALDRAQWAALRSLDENAALLRRLGLRAERRGDERLSGRFVHRAEDIESHAAVLRQRLLDDGGSGPS